MTLQLQQSLLEEYRALAELPMRRCATEKLRDWDGEAFSTYLASPACIEAWNKARQLMAPIAIPEMTGGVNPGDQQLIFQLIHYLQPTRILEIGTHIGASTLNIAAALHLSPADKRGSLTTVDIGDVNDEQLKPWLQYQSARSPRALLEAVGTQDLVSFVVSDSVAFLENTTQTFDFIFLDGDHSSRAVYLEIPLALERLAANGTILLHDYFPGLAPLWPTARLADSMLQPSVIPGPFLATQRLQREDNGCRVIPFGELPWPTKLGSRVTSLALLARDERPLPGSERP
jgi:predicted O-methyltransferase YrrM